MLAIQPQATAAAAEATVGRATTTPHGRQVEFNFSRSPHSSHASHTVERLDFPSPIVSPHPANNQIAAELYLPRGVTPNRSFPAVILLHILNGDFELERMLCRHLAQNGVIALFFKLPYYGERGGNAGRQWLTTDADTFINGLEQSFADISCAVDILMELPEVNPAAIGVSGISLGAIEAAITCGRDKRIAAAYLTLVGSGLKDIIAESREMRQFRHLLAQQPTADQERVWHYLEMIDPIHAAPALRRLAGSDSLRIICATDDQVIPAAAGRQLAEAADFGDRVTWLEGLDHYTALARLPRIMDEMTAFFARSVPTTWHPSPAPQKRSAPELVGVLLSNVATLLGTESPAVGAHLLGGKATWDSAGRQEEAKFDIARGPGQRFRISGHFPHVKELALGIGEQPWLQGGGQRLFSGEISNGNQVTLGSYISAQRLLRFQTAVAILTTAALVPEALSAYVTISEEDGRVPGRKLLLTTAHKKIRGRLELIFDDDDTPASVSWHFGESSGRVEFSYWRLNAACDLSLFEPPRATGGLSVRRDDLMRMLAAAAEYLLELTE